MKCSLFSHTTILKFYNSRCLVFSLPGDWMMMNMMGYRFYKMIHTGSEVPFNGGDKHHSGSFYSSISNILELYLPLPSVLLLTMLQLWAFLSLVLKPGVCTHGLRRPSSQAAIVCAKILHLHCGRLGVGSSLTFSHTLPFPESNPKFHQLLPIYPLLLSYKSTTNN